MDPDLARLRNIFDEVIQAPPERRAELLAARSAGDGYGKRDPENGPRKRVRMI
jgi:hypothetical protein